MTEIVGASRYYIYLQRHSEEVAVIVRDAYHGEGIDQKISERLIAVALERGVLPLVGAVLRANNRMLTLAKELGFRETKSNGRHAGQVVLDS